MVLIFFQKKTPGQWVFDHIVKKLEIIERDYFGLLYEDDHQCQVIQQVTVESEKMFCENKKKY